MSKNKQVLSELPADLNEKTEYTVEGMDCADCALHVEREVGKLPGVSKVVVNLITCKMEVHRSSFESDDQAVEMAVRGAGYRVRTGTVKEDIFYITDDLIQDQLADLEGQAGIADVAYNSGKQELHIVHTLSELELQSVLRRYEIKFRQKGIRKVVHLSLNITAGHLIASGLAVFAAFILDHNLLSRLLIMMGILAGAYPLIWRGFREIRTRQIGMNFLMTTAVSGALLIGEWAEAAMVIFLFILAQWLEAKTMERARRSIGSLLAQKPRMARRWINKKEQLVPVEDIMPGELVAVKPGEFIPLDGIVRTGNSFVDQSTITGESMPAEILPGHSVFAGTLNKNGYIEIEVRRKYKESTYAQIAEIVAEAQAKKAPKQIFVEKFSRAYTPVMIGFALIIAFVVPAIFGLSFIEWWYRALVLLVIACPCAFVISTPVTIISALTNAMRSGILIKGGVFLEEFARIKSMAFDKTGTITEGEPRVQEIYGFGGYTKNDVLAIACALEVRADHPIASSIVNYGRSNNINIPEAINVKVIEGKGVRGEINGDQYLVGNHLVFEENNMCDAAVHNRLEKIEDASHTVILVGNDQTVLGIISVADSIRTTTGRMISSLRELGISNFSLLTGDNLKTASEIAQKVNIDNVHADLLPQGKMEIINRIRHEYGPVAMIGDGINDAPALAAADIGIAMGASGSDTAIKTADIALMQNDLLKLPYLKKLSLKTVRVVKQNIFIALFLKFIFFLLTIPGWATLWMAVFADMGASLIVIFNGLRVLRNESLI